MNATFITTWPKWLQVNYSLKERKVSCEQGPEIPTAKLQYCEMTFTAKIFSFVQFSDRILPVI